LKPFYVFNQVGGTGGSTGAIGGPMHHSGTGSGSHTPMEIDEGIEIPAEKVDYFTVEESLLNLLDVSRKFSLLPQLPHK
jgi:hypothetical protein